MVFDTSQYDGGISTVYIYLYVGQLRNQNGVDNILEFPHQSHRISRKFVLVNIKNDHAYRLHSHGCRGGTRPFESLQVHLLSSILLPLGKDTSRNMACSLHPAMELLHQVLRRQREQNRLGPTREIRSHLPHGT